MMAALHNVLPGLTSFRRGKRKRDARSEHVMCSQAEFLLGNSCRTPMFEAITAFLIFVGAVILFASTAMDAFRS